MGSVGTSNVARKEGCQEPVSYTCYDAFLIEISFVDIDGCLFHLAKHAL